MRLAKKISRLNWGFFAEAHKEGWSCPYGFRRRGGKLVLEKDGLFSVFYLYPYNENADIFRLIRDTDLMCHVPRLPSKIELNCDNNALAKLQIDFSLLESAEIFYWVLTNCRNVKLRPEWLNRGESLRVNLGKPFSGFYRSKLAEKNLMRAKFE